MDAEHEQDGCCIWFSSMQQTWFLSSRHGDTEVQSEAEGIQKAKELGLVWRWNDNDQWEPLPTTIAGLPIEDTGPTFQDLIDDDDAPPPLINVRCKHCQTVLGQFEALDDHSGVRMLCPSCHKKVTIHNSVILNPSEHGDGTIVSAT
jgi:hypothetical protein